MLYFTRWKIAAILFVIAVGLVSVVPNFVPAAWRASWPSFLPDRRIALGLDLQGGARLLYKVDLEDYAQRRLEALVEAARLALGQAPAIEYTGLGAQGDAVQLRVLDADRVAEATARLAAVTANFVVRPPGDTPVDAFAITAGQDGGIRLVPTEDGFVASRRLLIQRSIEVVRERVAALGGSVPTVERAGAGRILIQAPGLTDPGRLKGFAGQPAELAVHLVEPEAALQEALDGRTPAGTRVLGSIDDPPVLYLVDQAPIVTGEDIATTEVGADGEEPVLMLRMTEEGTRKLAAATTANPGRMLAIAIDSQVVSTPEIAAPITDGRLEIAGDLEPDSVRDLAIALATGPLPARLAVVEERTVAADLGADSARAGVVAALVGAALVAVFMVLVYGFLGFLADVAVAVNVLLLLGVMSLLQATLTLPGIAGIVLTIGMAVDSNVLIYERIREEARHGHAAVMAIDSGFSRAFGTILDANVATLIAAAMMFFLGSGPVRGFAVTLAIGVVTTVFTAHLFTRLLVATWVRRVRPASVL